MPFLVTLFEALMYKLLRNPFSWLTAGLLLGFFLLVYPIFVIRPFRHQGATELAFALAVLQIRPVLGIGLALLAAFLTFRVFTIRRKALLRTVAVFLALLTIGFTALSRINVYELMFHPLDKPAFISASKSKLDGAEQVLAVNVNEAARAYPIRIVSYHHIINDVVAGEPIVATY